MTSRDVTTGRLSATPADLQQPLPADENDRPVANRETSSDDSRSRGRCQWVTDPLTRRPRRCRSRNTRIYEFGPRRDGSQVRMILCPPHFAAASKGLSRDGT